MQSYQIKEELPIRGEYDVIVAGGGVAGVSAAVAARRMGKSVLLIEKSIMLGGLATIGLVNYYEPLCNGRGIQIIKGMAEELFYLSIKYGFDTVPEEWKDKNPPPNPKKRYVTRFSVPLFSLALTEWVTDSGADILFDTIISKPIMDGKVCKGVAVENKSGRSVYLAKTVVDATGDADILFRAGVPTIQGKNYHTFYGYGVTLESCEKVIESGDMSKLAKKYSGAKADLYGKNHPEGKPYWLGTDGEEVSRYVVECHRALIDEIKDDKRQSRELIQLPTMPQFRTTRRIDGDYTMTVDDVYCHFDDSVSAICDFTRRDDVYELPYRTLVKSGFPNLITAGRSVSGAGFMWDILRVIPPAIITGQAAGIACAIAIDSGKPIAEIDVSTLQAELEAQNVMIHFDNSLIPKETKE